MYLKHLLFGFCSCILGTAQLFAQYTKEENFDKNWLFLKADAENANAITYNDANWRKLDLPHDWAIEGPFDKQYDCRTGALPVHGVAWYRKHFKIPDTAKGKVVRVEFEGAMYNANVWVNGHFLGKRPYGYIGFEFDISEFLNFNGKDNVIAVRLAPEDYASRWYPGAGIYRSVWLKIDEPVYVDLWGSYISTPTATLAKGVVQHETTIVNKSSDIKNIIVQHEYFDANDKLVATASENIKVNPGENTWSGTFADILNPKLWNVNTPNLYKAKTTLLDGENILDTYQATFGIRHITFDANGFYINRKKVRFQGVNLHHDNGSLGTAIYKRADERKLQIMKDMGVNAIRCSHNPPSREFLEVCDDMGILVIDEAYDEWGIAKVKNGYHKIFEEWGERDLQDMILRDRSHPSVVMWSIGNEILEQGKKDLGWKVAKRLNAICKNLDKSRPTTAGFNYYPAPYNFNMVQQVDIAGANYKAVKYMDIKSNYPDLPLYGSETSGVASSRGVYHYPVQKYQKHKSLQVTEYDIVGPPWVYPPDLEFHYQKENPNVLGEFIWTGVDYLGETSPYGGLDNIDNFGHWNSDYPSRSSYFGAVDLAGFPKDRFYKYQSQWTTKPMIHLMPHWNLSDKKMDTPVKVGDTIPVYAYTNCEEAELFLNGKSMGRKLKGKNKSTLIIKSRFYEGDAFDSPYQLSWMVPYQPGSIKVVGYNNGTAITEKEIKTAGKPAKIALSADRTSIAGSGKDLSYITIRIEDKYGNFCPLADNLIHFEISGNGKIVGVDNGNPISLESFQAPQRKAFNGLALAIIKANNEVGTIKLKAVSKGLKSDTIEIGVKNSETK